MENYLQKVRKNWFASDKDWHDGILRADGLFLTTTTTEGNSSLANKLVITNIYIRRGVKPLERHWQNRISHGKKLRDPSVWD